MNNLKRETECVMHVLITIQECRCNLLHQTFVIMIFYANNTMIAIAVKYQNKMNIKGVAINCGTIILI